jgi:hypothetical protein
MVENNIRDLAIRERLKIEEVQFGATEDRVVDIVVSNLEKILVVFPELRYSIRYCGTMRNQARALTLAINFWYTNMLAAENSFFLMQIGISAMIASVNEYKRKAELEFNEMLKAEQYASGRSYLPDCFEGSSKDALLGCCGIGINSQKLETKEDALIEHVILHEIGHHFAACFNMHHDEKLLEIAQSSNKETLESTISGVAADKIFGPKGESEEAESEYVAELLAKVFKNDFNSLLSFDVPILSPILSEDASSSSSSLDLISRSCARIDRLIYEARRTRRFYQD